MNIKVIVEIQGQPHELSIEEVKELKAKLDSLLVSELRYTYYPYPYPYPYYPLSGTYTITAGATTAPSSGSDYFFTTTNAPTNLTLT
jgi:hypothetical protein